MNSLSKRLTAAMVVGAAMPAVAMASGTMPGGGGAGGAGGGSGGNRYEIHLHAAPGMDEAKLMAMLERKLAEIEQRDQANRRASFADTQDWSDRA